MTGTNLKNHKVVLPNEWLEARKQFLIQEKEFTSTRARSTTVKVMPRKE